MKSINTCAKEFCDNCDIHSNISCHFSFRQLLRFYAIVLPSFILGGIGIYNYDISSLIIWILIIGLFFLIIEIRVLCTQCPHYKESSDTLRCWANYGAPKIWRYRPGPMNMIEKITLILGFITIWGYPIIFITLIKNWVLFGGYIFSVILFFWLLRKFNCKKCMNLSCPLNCVDIQIREKFLTSNPLIYDSWKNVN